MKRKEVLKKLEEVGTWLSSSKPKVTGKRGGKWFETDLTPMARAAADGIWLAIIMLRGEMPENMGARDIAECTVEYIARREAGDLK